MKPTLPLLGTRDLAAPLAWRRGAPISGGLFIAEAQVLATQLPAGRPINLCQDRYHFALGLAAALLRDQTSLMPPNALPETLRQVPAEGAPPYLLLDDPTLDTGGLPAFTVQRPAGLAPASAVPQIVAELQAVCLLTSGSTGAPQPHAKRWAALVTNIGAEAARLAELLGRPSLQGLTLVATVPAQHSYGFESSVLLALLGGAAFDAGRPFYPADIAQALQQVPAPRALISTPFHLKTLLLAGVPLPPTELVLSATAPLSPQLAAQAETALGASLVEIYGCTEAGQVATRRTTAGETWTTLGALRIHREGQGDDERFIVSGGHVLEPTPLADVLELQDDRRFRLLGRANDLIHVAGKRSSLAHLNFHLNRIDGVQDGAFWLPDAAGDAVVRPLAFVVAPGLGSREIIAALRANLEAAFVPRRVLPVAALPREATGKLTAAALQRFALATLAAAEPGARGPDASPEGGCDGGSEGRPATVAPLAPDDRPPLAGLPETVHIAADHPAFGGHFPGHPVLPGAVLLALVLQAAARDPGFAARLGATPVVTQAKFLRPVGPGALLQMVLQAGGEGVGFEVVAGDTVVARGHLASGSTP